MKKYFKYLDNQWQNNISRKIAIIGISFFLWSSLGVFYSFSFTNFILSPSILFIILFTFMHLFLGKLSLQIMLLELIIVYAFLNIFHKLGFYVLYIAIAMLLISLLAILISYRIEKKAINIKNLVILFLIGPIWSSHKILKIPY